MAECLDKVLEDRLKCPICQGRIVNARSLNCGHSYCKTCIEAVIQYKRDQGLNQMECPYCRKTMPTNCKLKDNWMITNIVDAVEQNEKQREDLKGNYCSIHPERRLEFYCEQCSVVTCALCTVKDHFGHFKRPITITEMVTFVQGKIRKEKEESATWLRRHAACERAGENMRKDGLTKMQQMEDEIISQFDTRVELLTQETNNLIAQIQEQRLCFESLIDQLLLKKNKVTERVTQARDWGEKQRISKDEIQMLIQYRQWETILRQDLNEDFTDTNQIERKLEDIKSLYFEPVPLPVNALMEVGFIGDRKQDRSSTMSTRLTREPSSVPARIIETTPQNNAEVVRRGLIARILSWRSNNQIM